MKKKAFSAIIILVFFTSAVGSLQLPPFVSANPDGSYPALSMPVEYVNYTITRINGTLWAKIDGDYPIYIQKQSGCAFNGDLPMVYPMPPGSTNIHVTLGDEELSWSNYTESNPGALHHTAIGDWWMIYSVLGNVSDYFMLKIHYEHPLEVVNGSYLFLYDLNISPYLNPEITASTAYFSLRFETNVTNLHAYTTETDNQWHPINYTAAKEGSTTVVAIQMRSEYDEPLLGDLVVVFSNTNEVAEFPTWLIPVSSGAVLLVMLLYIKRNKVLSALSSRKTAN
jgi:hypothetical protein